MSEINDNQELLSAYLDGELSRSELKRVNKLLAVSEECRRDLAALRRAKALIRSVAREPMPLDLMISLQAKGWEAQRIQKAQAVPSPIWYTAGAIAAVVLVSVWIRNALPTRKSPLPLGPFLAAHSRYHMDSSLHQGAMMASNFSEAIDAKFKKVAR